MKNSHQAKSLPVEDLLLSNQTLLNKNLAELQALSHEVEKIQHGEPKRAETLNRLLNDDVQKTLTDKLSLLTTQVSELQRLAEDLLPATNQGGKSEAKTKPKSRRLFV